MSARITNSIISALVLAICLSTPCLGQSVEADSARQVTDSMTTEDFAVPPDSTEIMEPSVEYPEFFTDTPDPNSEFASSYHEINLAGNGRRIYYSLGDALKSKTAFYNLKYGPLGQVWGITYLGLPPYMFSLSPDHAGSYFTYRFPPSGMRDQRLFSLEQGEKLILEQNSLSSPLAAISVYSNPPDDRVPETELSVFKGDYSFANTDVRFRQLVNDRFGWDFNIGVEQSSGYILNSGKRRENYGLNLHFKLTPEWQTRARVRFMRTDDSLAYLGTWSGFEADRNDYFRGVEVNAVRQGSNGNRIGGSVSYQTAIEKIRSRKFNLTQEHHSVKLGADLIRRIDRFDLFATSRFIFNRVEFGPGYDYYSRLNLDGGIRFDSEKPVSYLIVGRYLYDWGGVSRLGGGARVSIRSDYGLRVGASADLADIPPSDMARFLQPQGFDLNEDGAQEYNHDGDRGLEPTTISSISGSFGFERGRFKLDLLGRVGRIVDMVIWQSYEGARGGLYRPETRDADLSALTAGATVIPLAGASLTADYTYSKLMSRQNDERLSLMPRHNVYAILAWKMHIEKLRLDLFPGIEAEYHSTNYKSNLNSIDLEDYFLLHGRIAVKIKTFTFYYTMENIFNKTHETVHGYPSFRTVWWGFRWTFFN